MINIEREGKGGKILTEDTISVQTLGRTSASGDFIGYRSGDSRLRLLSLALAASAGYLARRRGTSEAVLSGKLEI